MIKSHGAAHTSLQFAEVSAKITRADGTVEELVLDRYERIGHKMRRIGRKVLPWLLIAALAGGAGVAGTQGAERISDALHRHPDVGTLLTAPLMLGATVIVNGGHAIVTNRMIGSGTEPKFVAWGTGAGTAAASDTTLFTESTDESRTSGTSSRVTTTNTNDTYQVVGTITVATSNKTITNVGLFDASTSGNLYFKSDFTGLALNIGDSIQFTIKVKFS